MSTGGDSPAMEMHGRAVELLRAGERERALQLLRSALATDLEHACVLGPALEQLGHARLALELSAGLAQARDHELSCLRSRWALRTGQPELALAEAEIAIEFVLQHGLSLPEFLRLALRSAPSEILFRFERQAVARRRSLHLPLALRWEALRRAGRRAEAREMRAVCTRLFPERASVWSEAGNHALDDGELERAEQYFERCLSLDASWTAAVAGKAIVLETRKDWSAALALRRRVVELENALARDDLASLQRTLRYAAALGRVGQWQEAEVWFRRCALRGAYAGLPAERPVLLRVFTRELYAPALVAMLQPAPDPLPPEAALALHEARVFANAYACILALPDLDPAERLALLGMCAWLAGDYERAYTWLDEAEVAREGDPCIQLLLTRCARAIGATECESIERFALDSARALLGQPGRASLRDLYYASIALGMRELAPPPASEHDVAALVQTLVAERVRPASPLTAAGASADLLAKLEQAVSTVGVARVTARSDRRS